MRESIRLRALIPAPPPTTYCAWLALGQDAKVADEGAAPRTRLGTQVVGWDGYAQSEILEIEPGRHIVQSWRSRDFPVGAPPSSVEVSFGPTKYGTELVLVHRAIPAGHKAVCERGWIERYLRPLQRRFRALAVAKAARRAAPRKALPKPTARPRAQGKRKRRRAS